MISEKMKPVLANNSAIRSMFEEGIRMAEEVGKENVYDFSLGNPNVPAPKAVEESIRALLSEKDPVTLHGYMPNAGFLEVREKLAEDLNRRFQTAFSGKNLIMTAGAAGGLNALLKSILNEGDEVIVFAPYFMEYRNYVQNFGGVIVEVETDRESFLPEKDRLLASLSPRTKAVIINTPNNPTGVIYGEDTLKELADCLKEAQERYHTDILLISDEPYRELCYDGEEAPFVTKFCPNTAVVYSYSKSLSLPGERIGYVLIPDAVKEAEELIDAVVTANRILGSVNAPSLMQLVVARCGEKDVLQNREAYDEKRRMLYDIVTGAGFEAVYPKGAFYLWIKAPGGDDAAFTALCKKHHLLVVPGSSFSGKGYVRAAYCVSEETIERSREAWKAAYDDVQNAIQNAKMKSE